MRSKSIPRKWSAICRRYWTRRASSDKVLVVY